jgi:molybdopterin molybdotransferase
MRRGAEMTRGQIVLGARTQLRPAEIGVLAAVGRACVPVFPRPRVAVISTGNEIVEADQTPGPGQIRNSNGPTLAALVAAAGGEPRYLGIARDTRYDLRRLARAGLDDDIVILSGGVSAGDLDLVPGVLRELGVREVFHKVDLKPGKPVWFGVVESREPRVKSSEVSDNTDRAESQLSTLVFGLPGNPVSVIVCFELFVRPAIRQILGLAPAVSPLVTATLGEDKNYRSGRPTYWPARLEFGDGGCTVRPVAWLGSPDLRATTEANAFIFFPPGDHKLRAGDSVRVLACDW